MSPTYAACVFFKSPQGWEKRHNLGSGQTRVQIRELAFWWLHSLFGQMELKPRSHSIMRGLVRGCISKYLIITANILPSTMLLVCFLIWSQPHSMRMRVLPTIHRRGPSGERCDLINVKQLEKEAQIKPSWGWCQNLSIYPTWCFLLC